MALTGDTGNGATLTLPGSYSVAVESIEPGVEKLDALSVSVLGTTTTDEKIPSDLIKVSASKARFKWVSTVAKPTLGTVGTITITLPLQGALTNAATYSGTGFISSWKPPALKNGEVMMGEVEFEFDGDTGPTYTVAS